MVEKRARGGVVARLGVAVSGAVESVAGLFDGRAGGAIDSSRTFNEARDAVEAASIFPREPNDDGPRIAVHSLSLFGGFIYSREEASRRIKRAFPDLADDELKRVVRMLENRVVAIATAPPMRQTRNVGWVNDWRN